MSLTTTSDRGGRDGPASLYPQAPGAWRLARYEEYRRRSRLAGTGAPDGASARTTELPETLPEIRDGLVYRDDDDWHVRRTRIATRHVIHCYRGHRHHVSETVHVGIRHCSACGRDGRQTLWYVVQTAGGCPLVVDIALYEARLAQLLRPAELLEWLGLAEH